MVVRSKTSSVVKFRVMHVRLLNHARAPCIPELVFFIFNIWVRSPPRPLEMSKTLQKALKTLASLHIYFSPYDSNPKPS